MRLHLTITQEHYLPMSWKPTSTCRMQPRRCNVTRMKFTQNYVSVSACSSITGLINGRLPNELRVQIPIRKQQCRHLEKHDFTMNTVDQADLKYSLEYKKFLKISTYKCRQLHVTFLRNIKKNVIAISSTETTTIQYTRVQNVHV